jgi:hypothetical protein
LFVAATNRKAGPCRRQETIMANAYVIEIGGDTVGIVAPDGRGVRFHAALRRFNPLDGLVFRSANEAERAARRIVAGRKGGAGGNWGEFA